MLPETLWPSHVKIISSVLEFPVPYNKKEKENSCQQEKRVVKGCKAASEASFKSGGLDSLMTGQ